MSTLILDIIGRDKGATKLLKELSGQTDKTNKQFAAFGKIVTVAGVAAGAALIKFGKDSVKAYSEAQQSQLKLQDAFQRFPKLADTNIAALRGLNTELAKKTRFDDDATASGQAVLAQFELTGREITQLTPLLQDYAAKTGRDLPDAAKLLGKAMLGNGRALKDVGINFKDTGDRGKNFDQIMKGLRTQVGGFAEKEGKTAAGQVEILKNQFGELQEEAGSHLLPTLNKIVGGTTKAVVAFSELEPGVKGALGGFAVALPTLLLAAGGIVKIASAAKGAKVALDGMSSAAKKATLAASGVGIALGIAALAFGAWAAKNAEAKEQVKSLRDQLVESNGVITDSIRLGKQKELQDNGQAAAAEKLGINLDTLARAHLGEAGAIAEVNKVLDAAIEAGTKHIQTSRGMITRTDAHAAAAKKLQEDLAAGNITLEEAQKQAKDLAAATKTTGNEQETMAGKTKKSREELNKWRESMFKAANAAIQLQASQDGVEAAVDDATASVKTNGKTLDNNTEKGRANRQALRNIASASNDYREKLIEQGASTKRVTNATDDGRKAFIKSAEKMGLSRKRAEELADKYGLVDRKINDLNDKKVKISYSTNAGRLATAFKLGLTLNSGEQKGGGSRSAVGNQAGGPPLTISHGRGSASGGPDGVVSPQLHGQVAMPNFNALSNRLGRGIGRELGERIGKKLDAFGTSPTGSVGSYSAGQAATIARLRAAGARSFTTYPGHHPSMARARDVTPHNWHIANTARASSGVWYVIYQMKIASKNHGNTWNTYRPSNFRGDWQHRRHVHVAWYDRGGMLATNGTGQPERVLSPGQTKSFDQLVKVISGNRGGNVGVTYIINAPNYVGDKRDLVKALTDLNRQGRLEVVRR